VAETDGCVKHGGGRRTWTYSVCLFAAFKMPWCEFDQSFLAHVPITPLVQLLLTALLLGHSSRRLTPAESASRFLDPSDEA
jgi:hypothetical protein